MIVIVEGLKNTGKTALCKYLETRGFKHIDLGLNRDAPKGVNERDFKSGKMIALCSILESKSIKENVVIERFHLYEWVYGLVDRKSVTPFAYEIEKCLVSLGAKMIVMIDDSRDIESRIGSDQWKYESALEALLSFSRIDRIEYRISSEPIEKVTNWLGLTNNETEQATLPFGEVSKLS